MDLTASKEVNTADGKYPTVHNGSNALLGTPLIVIHAYEVSLAASKEKERQLLSELEETRQRQRELEMLQQKSKAKANSGDYIL